MKLIVGDRTYSNFTEASIKMRFDALCSSFMFHTAGSEIASSLRNIRVGDSCQVTVSDVLVLTGYIEKRKETGAAGAHDLVLEGRDKTVDLLESQIGTLSDINPPMTLRNVTSQVLRHIAGRESFQDVLAFDDEGGEINVEDQTGLRVTRDAQHERARVVRPDFLTGLPDDYGAISAFNAKVDRLVPEPGDLAFSYLEKLARKRQVFFTTAPDGTLLVVNPAYPNTAKGARVVNQYFGEQNNVINYARTLDNTKRFRTYITTSQGSSVVNQSLAPDAIATVKGEVEDGAIRVGRQFVLEGEQTWGRDDNQNRIIWEQNIRRTKSDEYRAQVKGFQYAPGKNWPVGQLVSVQDEVVGINEQRLLTEVEFKVNLKQGRVTNLMFLPRDAFSLTLTGPLD
jgi:prophage tail gpP-like protein